MFIILVSKLIKPPTQAVGLCYHHPNRYALPSRSSIKKPRGYRRGASLFKYNFNGGFNVGIGINNLPTIYTNKTAHLFGYNLGIAKQKSSGCTELLT